MATCKECVLSPMCCATTSYFALGLICQNFKNKADYVEVVRCEKCKYGDVSVFSKTKEGQEEIACYCNLKNAVTDVDGYCPSGERKHT